MRRIVNLLAPGGYFCVADFVARSEYTHHAPILTAALKTLEEKYQEKGMTPWFPARLAGVLRAAQVFDEITVKTVVLPMNPVLVSGACMDRRELR